MPAFSPNRYQPYVTVYKYKTDMIVTPAGDKVATTFSKPILLYRSMTVMWLIVAQGKSEYCKY